MRTILKYFEPSAGLPIEQELFISTALYTADKIPERIKRSPAEKLFQVKDLPQSPSDAATLVKEISNKNSDTVHALNHVLAGISNSISGIDDANATHLKSELDWYKYRRLLGVFHLYSLAAREQELTDNIYFTYMDRASRPFKYLQSLTESEKYLKGIRGVIKIKNGWEQHKDEILTSIQHSALVIYDHITWELSPRTAPGFRSNDVTRLTQVGLNNNPLNIEIRNRAGVNNTNAKRRFGERLGEVHETVKDRLGMLTTPKILKYSAKKPSPVVAYKRHTTLLGIGLSDDVLHSKDISDVRNTLYTTSIDSYLGFFGDSSSAKDSNHSPGSSVAEKQPKIKPDPADKPVGKSFPEAFLECYQHITRVQTAWIYCNYYVNQQKRRHITLPTTYPELAKEIREHIIAPLENLCTQGIIKEETVGDAVIEPLKATCNEWDNGGEIPMPSGGGAPTKDKTKDRRHYWYGSEHARKVGKIISIHNNLDDDDKRLLWGIFCQHPPIGHAHEGKKRKTTNQSRSISSKDLVRIRRCLEKLPDKESNPAWIAMMAINTIP
ncbi:MAG: hypothetical protein ABW148_17725 [Sedimenticola sp.]